MAEVVWPGGEGGGVGEKRNAILRQETPEQQCPEATPKRIYLCLRITKNTANAAATEDDNERERFHVSTQNEKKKERESRPIYTSTQN